MEITDTEHDRLKEIEAALDALLGSCWASGGPNVERAKKALLPIYEPLVPDFICMADYRLNCQDAVVKTLEAAADRLEAKYSGTNHAHHLRDWAKSERAIVS